MSITPRGMSVQEAYRHYQDGNLLVNRMYQRKLVWTVEEKQKLIDSMLRGYPIPLILLAERPKTHGAGMYEIIDGIQRFNAIFTFIENAFDLDGHYFDISEFARAKQLAEEDAFAVAPDNLPRLSPKQCADLLDYQLAVTIYPTTEAQDITEVFGRINAHGRQLSAQEKRQAGVTMPFSEMVRFIASELRGDVSREVIRLDEMPEISIESGRSRLGYGITAEETIWCKQGILSVKQLRDSEDEQTIADIASSILKAEPLAASQEALDKLYDPTTQESQEIETYLSAYSVSCISQEIKTTFSVLREIIEECSNEPNYLRSIVRPGTRYPIKTPFYAIFMALFDLIVQQKKSPDNSKAIMRAIENLSEKLTISTHYATTEDRKHNINLTKGLIQDYFADKVPPVLGHGPGLAMDFENSLRRSKIETPRYEFKQGFLRLYDDRKFDDELVEALAQTMCGIANLGPDSTGYVFIGVADSEDDAKRIEQLDGVVAKKVANHFVVGIDREVNIMGLSLDDYIRKIVDLFKATELTDLLKTDVLSNFDTVVYHGFSVLRITVPAQKEMAFVGNDCFLREGSSTVKTTGPQIAAVAKRFQ